MKHLCLCVVLLLVCTASSQAQHLWWNLDGAKDAACLYGEITVIATAPHIYYCGANWHPGEPAGGYCGIQHNTMTERRTIFSIWDTSPELHPKVLEADPKTVHNRFGGEGEGGHTHMIWPWKVDETFQFFVRKSPGKADTTDTAYYIYDGAQNRWRHIATISNPNGGKASVKTFGGGMNSFLENFAGKDRATPKLAIYRLWLGSSVDTMKYLAKARGDGIWGQLHEAYFLAEGDPDALEKVFEESKAQYGQRVLAQKGQSLKPLKDRPLNEDLIAALKQLPTAGAAGTP